MQTQFVGITAITALLMVPLGAGSAAAQCCGEHKAHAMKNCCAMADDPVGTAEALSVLLPKPEVRTAMVQFRGPVRVGEKILMGRYIIEHDDARMARGEPCTYIFGAHNARLPVVTFHCTHLERPGVTRNTVVLRPGRGSNQSVKELTEFQFAGETASHGVPDIF